MAAIRHRPAATRAINECGRLPLLRHSLRSAGRGILPFGSARSVWSNTPSRPLGSDRNDVAANCRDVEGNHRLGQAPQGERAELLGFDASFERRVDALAEQDFQVDAAGGGGAVGAVGVAVGSLADPLPVPGLIAPWALPFRSRKSALRRATRRFTVVRPCDFAVISAVGPIA